MAEVPWDGCKVAFGIENPDRLWKWHDKHNYKPPLPEGWSIDGTDSTGARVVAIFRVKGELLAKDGKTVKSLLRKLRIL